MAAENQEKGVSSGGVIKSFSWSYAEKIATQLMSFVLSIILARLLMPEDYGKLALVNIFITIVKAATVTGFGSALIQKKNATDTDFSSTLLFSLGIACLAYGALFLAAPAVSWIMGQDITSYFRVASLSLIIVSASAVFHAYVIRKMQFYKIFIASIIGVAVSGVIGITMAYQGFGVWALVVQHLSNSVVNTIVSIIICGWKPKAEFSRQSVKQVYSFGWKLIVSSVIDAIYRQLRSLVIGKKYSSEDLAFYDRGLQYPNLVVANVDTSIASVLAPALARKQDDLHGLKFMVMRGVKTSSVVLFPLLIGLAVCAKPIVLLMLTEKWLPCVPYLQVLSIALMLKPIQTANLQGILAIGRSDIYLKIQTIQKIIGVGMIAITIIFFNDPFAVAVGELAAYILFAIINAYPNVKYLKYTVSEQITNILPQLIVATIMGGLVYLVSFLQVGTLVLLILQVLTGAVFYIGVMYLFKVDAFMYLWRMLISRMLKR